MANGGGLKDRLDAAIVILQDIYKKDGTRTEADNAAIDQATQTLISVHKAIDDFRDQSRAGLARTRVHLIWAGLMTAVVAYILLALAILDDVPAYQIVAGAAFFLVGAVSGLIWQLRSSGSEIRSGEDDFGLDQARLVYVPILSGLAGVGGVLVLAMLYPTLNVVPDTSSAADVRADVPAISAIFDLNRNRFGLLVAAVFGLTPDLLINRLQGEADRYRRQLEASSVQTRADAPPVISDALIDRIAEAVGAKITGGADQAGGTSGQGAVGSTEGREVYLPAGSSGSATQVPSTGTGGFG
jgi:hypothetical protein